MKTRIAALAFGLIVGATEIAVADEWVRLDGRGIDAALTARVLAYPDGTMQDFHAGGRTLAGMGEGRWKVDGDHYCSAWPPSENWACYEVDREARGLDLRFTGKDGAVTVGRYNDLQ
jgi:hypothetical protein